MADPEPLTPAECDLRDFAFMPLDVQRLRDSDLAALESPEACWAAVLLWCVAWHQVPPGSLPDDDRLLARFTGYQRAPRDWQRIRPGAMRGWIKCSDGRLYHPVIAEKAKEAWTGKLRQRWQTECARVRKANERREDKAPVPTWEEWSSARQAQSVTRDTGGVSHGQSQDVACDNPALSRGQSRETLSKGQGQGQGQGQGDSSELRSAAPPDDPPPDARTTLFRDGLAILRQITGKPEHACRKLLGSLLKTAGDDAAAVLAATRRADETRPAEPVAWLTAAARRIGAGPSLQPASPALRAGLLDIPSPFDPPDYAGYRPWLMSLPNLRLTKDGSAYELHGWLPDGVAEAINEAVFASGTPFADRVDWSWLEGWCRDGIPERDGFAATIQRVARSVSGPIRSLKLFDQAVRELRRAP
jgi:hypothetical protein